jgi:hypothetical protein
MKYLISFFIIISYTKCYSQKIPVAIKEGIYSGGICLDGAICGDWIFKPDSSFVFIEFDKSCIKKIGMGNIKAVSDSFITVQFTKTLPILSKSKIEYISETKHSFDSIYFYGQLKNTLNEPIPYATILYSNKWSSVSDSKGNFNAVFPSKEKLDQIEIINNSDGYSPIKVQLNQNNNYHKLIITIPNVYSDSCFSVESSEMENATYTFRIFNNAFKRGSSLSLIYVSSDEKQMINKLSGAKNKQPFLSSNIEALINYISK